MKLASEHLKMGYRIDWGILTRTIDEHNHMMHSLDPDGSVICIDAKLWDRHYRKEVMNPDEEFNRIKCPTNQGHVFEIEGHLFDKFKQSIDHGHGLQYWVRRKLWIVSKGGEPIKPRNHQLELF